jgi:hypothetical protein|tara:strand:- start:142 stop:438 length:297 start_codon:yes stop_codon:yes gene_type:complete
MPEFTNTTGLEFIDIVKEGMLNQFFGSFELAVLGVVAFIIIGLMVIGARREAVLMTPIPMLFHVVSVSTTEFKWIFVVALLGLGIFIALPIWRLFSQK